MKETKKSNIKNLPKLFLIKIPDFKIVNLQDLGNYWILSSLRALNLIKFQFLATLGFLLSVQNKKQKFFRNPLVIKAFKKSNKVCTILKLFIVTFSFFYICHNEACFAHLKWTKIAIILFLLICFVKFSF